MEDWTETVGLLLIKGALLAPLHEEIIASVNWLVSDSRLMEVFICKAVELNSLANELAKYLA